VAYEIICSYINYLINAPEYREELRQPKDDKSDRFNYFSYDEIIGVDRNVFELNALYRNL